MQRTAARWVEACVRTALAHWSDPSPVDTRWGHLALTGPRCKHKLSIAQSMRYC